MIAITKHSNFSNRGGHENFLGELELNKARKGSNSADWLIGRHP